MRTKLKAPRSATPHEKSGDERRHRGGDVGRGGRVAGRVREGDAGLSARMGAVERLIALNDEVGDPEQLEDEIIRGAIDDGERVEDDQPTLVDVVHRCTVLDKEKA